MKFILYLLLLLQTALLSAQFTVRGTVQEQNSKLGLEFATVMLINPTTNELVTGSTTDVQGNYELKVTAGTYDLKVDFIGFKPITRKGIKITKNETIATIFLQESSEQLKEVEVIAEKSTTEYKLDKRIFNVGKDLLSKGGTATDILNNVPSVSVDAEGAISLRGNANVRVLINGKPSVLTNNNGIEQIPAETIERIEVITNPSARYDAEGTAGILNILLKKNKVGGFSSALQLSAGEPADHGVNYNINYKTEKFNIFSNFRYQDVEYLGEESIFRTNFTNGTASSFLDQSTEISRTRKTFNAYLGSDIYFNDKNTTTFSYYYRHNDRKNKATYDFNFLDANKTVDEILQNIEVYEEPQRANRLELNHVMEFAKKGQKLTFDLQYDFWNDDENEYVNERNITTNTLTNLRSRDIESSKDFLFQTDLKMPLANKQHIEFGLKGEIRNIDSDYKVWDNTVLVDSLNNLLKYQERIYGAYAQYGNKANKFQYLLGLRAEHSNTGSTDRRNEFKTDKKYTNLFPTVHLTYNFTPRTNLQVSYSRRIRRPSFWHLNPFGGIADRRNIRIGNPDLDPMFTNSFDLGFLKRWKGFTINPSVYYQHTTQLFETQVNLLSNGVAVAQTINSGTENRLGAELAIQYSPYKWWRLSSEFNYFSFNQKGIYTVNDAAWTTRLNSRMRFPNFTMQTSFNYQGERTSGQTVNDAIYWADIAASKDFLDDRLSITANIRNVFDSRIRKQLVTGEDYTIFRDSKFIGRRFGVTLTYRFNRSKKDRDRLPD